MQMHKNEVHQAVSDSDSEDAQNAETFDDLMAAMDYTPDDMKEAGIVLQDEAGVVRGAHLQHRS